jgi:probable HAF family extracellular repeat protein
VSIVPQHNECNLGGGVMKSRTVVTLIAGPLFAVLALTVRLPAQEQDHKLKHHHYKLIEIGTLGGPSSNFNNFYDGPFFDSGKVLNKHRTLAGWADTSVLDPFPSLCLNPDCFASHAFQWHDGIFTDLGTLAPDWSSQVTWINDRGDIVGLSQNGVIDPLIGFPEQRAVLWRNGNIADLGTLGGNQSVALAVNNRGQIAGLALNTTPDPFSIYDLLYFNSPNGTQTRAVLWDNAENVQDLGTLGGPDAYALLVNEHGQVAGWSYTNSIPNASSGGLPTFHPFLWEEGKGMQDLGTLGGTIAQAVNGLNERGEVVGATTLAGDNAHHPFLWNGKKLIDLGTLGGENGEAIWVNNVGEVIGGADYTAHCQNGLGGEHGFLWKNGVMSDLGSINGIPNSEADYINDKTQIVGNAFSCDFSTIDAFLWEKDSIVDLNSLISPESSIHLAVASYIDGRGEIVAIGVLPNGDGRAVLLIPCDENHPNAEGCDYSWVEAADSANAANRVGPGTGTQGPIASAPRVPILNNPVNLMLRPFGRRGLALSPKQFGTRTDTSPIAESGSGSQKEPLGGIGTTAKLSPTSLSFGTVAIGTISQAKSVTLTNVGTTTLAISGIVITGTNARDFAQTHTCGSLLAAGASCSISVTFTPTASGTRTAALSITDNAAGSPQKVPLSGIGTTAKVSPTSMGFGSVFIGTTSPAEAATLTNVSTATLNIANIAISGTDAGDFAQTSTCGSSLAAGASCSISVRFKPTASGTRTAALSITDNAAGSPQKVSLSGTGIAGRCSRFDQLCGPGHPPCCSGLTCVFRGPPTFWVCE